MRFRSSARRLLPAVAGALAAAALGAASAHAHVTMGNWDLSLQRQVVRAGLMTNLSNGSFGGSDRLTGAQANAALAALAAQQASVTEPAAHTSRGERHDDAVRRATG